MTQLNVLRNEYVPAYEKYMKNEMYKEPQNEEQYLTEESGD